MRFITMEINLTEFGMMNYKKILAIIFHYFKTVRDDWMDPEKGQERDQIIPLFREC